MTVCIAMMFDDNKSVVVASDRMTTGGYPPMEFEHKRNKINEINKKSVMLSAGDALIPKEINTTAKKKIGELTAPSIHSIMKTVKEAFIDLRMENAEDKFLRTRGVTVKEFYDEYIRRWPEGIAQAVDRGIATEILGVEIIIAGVDEDGAHIYALFDPGRSSCYDALGYTAIGSGQYHALALITSGYEPSFSEKDALKLISEAKRVSEVAPGVGKRTDIAIINKDGIRRLTQEEVASLVKLKA